MISIWPRLAALVAIVAALAVVADALDGRWVLSAACGAAAVVCIVVGVRRHHPPTAAPWWFVGAALASFTVAVLVYRYGTVDASDVCRVVGYCVLGVGLIAWLTAYRRREDVDPLVDGVLVSMSVMLLTWVVVLSPILARADSSLSTAQSLYPAFDVALATLVAYLAMSTPGENRSLQWMLSGFVLFFLADMANSAISGGVLDVPLAVRTAGYSAGALALGAAALDRSMVNISPMPIAPPPRTPERGALAVIVLVTCSVFPVVYTAANRADLIVRSVLLSLIVIGTFMRGERALRAVKAAKDRARYEADHDALTGLLGRSALVDVACRSSRASTPVTVLFVDLDNFKFVNDSYGHSVGDELIREVASRILVAVGPDDDVIRYAGDEFVVTTDVDRARAGELAQRLVESIARPFSSSIATFSVTATVGVSTVDSIADAAELTALIADADTAMYHAKSLGPNSVSFFDEPLRALSTAATATATALRGACARGEFEVFYQPIVATGSRRTVVYEALVRWRRGGEVTTPDEFVPIAESIDLIGEIGEFVLDRSMADLAALQTAGGPDITMSVNVSAIQLRDRSLPNVVRDILSRHGVPGSSLSLEVTESALLGDFDSAHSVIRQLKDLGVLIVLDDFGVGFSSLSRLQRLPIDVVKIDKSFVADVERGESATTLLLAIGAMLDAMGILSVAEGVETEEQLRVVERVGCRFAQGFLFSRAYPLEHWVTSSPESPAPAATPPPSPSRT
ncbi:putative bifunctional diguanylate cyclase/phosphodiesterase [Actinomycetes bacterium M1A6_2h]